MKNNLLCGFCVAGIFLVAGCDNFLDRAADVNLDEEKVFSNYETAYKYQADIYSSLRKGFNVLGGFQPAPLACATDEAEASSGWHTTNNLNIGAYDDVDNVLERNYTGIRKSNMFLSRKDVIPFPDSGVKASLTGEVYFLRAFYFHEIIKRYGGMPILNDKLLYPNDNLQLPRNTYKECVNVILQDLDNAIDLLPATVGDNELGRASKGAAMALKSRVLLYAASPLWNREFTDTDKWQQAADAALALINLKEDGISVYELYNTGQGADDYEQQFFVRAPDNKEVIFWHNDSPKKFTDEEIAVWAPDGAGFEGGAGAIWVTQNFVDLFEMANGKLYDEAGSGYDAANPYADRDPRFYKTVIYNGAVWQGVTIETFVGGNHRLKSTNCRTGYYVRKYLPETVKANSSATSYHNWQYIRLAEIYLNYAEAINEAEGTTKAYPFVNAIRTRSGMPVLPDNLTQDQMREHIKRERAIELSFEEHRWWDVRRWLEGEKYFDGSFFGMNVIKNNDGTFTYEREVFEKRLFTSKMNLYPIPISEMNKNIQYEQNTGW